MSTGEHPENQRNLAYYCQRFSELNVSSSHQRGNAHYKPILLLSVIDLVAQNLIIDNQITVSDELINTFNKYWNILASTSYKGGLHYPFFHLQSDGFWHLEFKPNFNGLQPKTTNKLKDAVQYAYLDSELFNLLQDPLSRQDLIDILVASWFSDNRKKIEEILKINQGFQDTNKLELEPTEHEPRFIFKKSAVRNAFFRKAIVHIYDYRCAFCKLKVTRSISQTIVDGAHIKPFALFYNSRADNGISLCKNHHWAFDYGWFGIDDNFKILVASNLQEQSPNAKPMKDFQGELILLPSSEQYFPSIEALQWHRRNVFKL
ncbi:HNH endonuclease [Coleofasciculus sp. FACHB-SPT9]|uniref:HNH endonuclease n=1 Tax=Cyanophyceae TaxID=3028117 RepID=UPI00168767A5|nr:HNH endonuclease [Coleofasciculus sp. FACHB-SPT9]MBD1889269.1 HNH endonuclease [Coleofasciculus sp. FACHB-SPT9]